MLCDFPFYILRHRHKAELWLVSLKVKKLVLLGQNTSLAADHLVDHKMISIINLSSSRNTSLRNELILSAVLKQKYFLITFLLVSLLRRSSKGSWRSQGTWAWPWSYKTSRLNLDKLNCEKLSELINHLKKVILLFDSPIIFLIFNYHFKSHTAFLMNSYEQQIFLIYFMI